MRDIPDVLHYTALCRHMDLGDLSVLSGYVTSVSGGADSVVYAQGDAADAVYVIESGRVELSRKSEEGKLEVVAMLKNGDFFGEGALLEGSLRDHSATCLDDTTLYCLEHWSYGRLAQEHPRIAAKLLGFLSDKLKAQATGEFDLARGSSCQIVTFFSGKDGVGKTFLASNFAALAAKRHGLRVCLLEFDLQFGNLASFLGINPKKTLWDIVAGENLQSVESRLLLNYAARPCEGLNVFVRPRDISEAERIQPQHVTLLVNHLQRFTDLVVVDCRAGFDELSLTICDVSDKVFVVTTADFGGVAVTRNLLNVLHSLHYSTSKLQLLINQSTRERDIPPSEKKFLFEGSTAVVPFEPKVYESLNSAKLWSFEFPSHPLTRQIYDLVGTVVKRPVAEASPAAGTAKVGFLQKWLHWFGNGRKGDEGDGDLLSEHPLAAEGSIHGRRGALSEFALGHAYYLVGRYDVASRSFEKAIEQDKTLSSAFYFLGEIASFDQNRDGAKLYYQAALQHNPRCLRYQVRHAMMAKASAQTLPELKATLEACELHPRYADLRYLLASLYFGLGEMGKAGTQLLAALKINPRYVEALCLQGQVFHRAGRDVEALEALLLALEYNVNHVPAIFELGELFADMNLFAFAHESYRKVLDVYPGHTPSHRKLLELQEPIRILQQEIERYGEAIALHPSFGDLRYKVALAYFQLGAFDRARHELDSAQGCRFDRQRVSELAERLDVLGPLLEGTFLLPARAAQASDAECGQGEAAAAADMEGHEGAPRREKGLSAPSEGADGHGATQEVKAST